MVHVIIYQDKDFRLLLCVCVCVNRYCRDIYALMVCRLERETSVDAAIEDTDHSSCF